MKSVYSGEKYCKQFAKKFSNHFWVLFGCVFVPLWCENILQGVEKCTFLHRNVLKTWLNVDKSVTKKHFVYDHTEGHALAKRLSKQIMKATKLLKTSIDEYNKLECSTASSLPLTVTFDSVKDPDSDVWVEVNAPGESRTAIPATIRRKAVDLYYLMDRCREEITLLQSEMINTLDHFTRQHQLFKSSLDFSLGNLSAESRGRDIFIRKKVLSIEWYLVY